MVLISDWVVWCPVVQTPTHICKQHASNSSTGLSFPLWLRSCTSIWCEVCSFEPHLRLTYATKGRNPMQESPRDPRSIDEIIAAHKVSRRTAQRWRQQGPARRRGPKTTVDYGAMDVLLASVVELDKGLTGELAACIARDSGRIDKVEGKIPCSTRTVYERFRVLLQESKKSMVEQA